MELWRTCQRQEARTFPHIKLAKMNSLPRRKLANKLLQIQRVKSINSLHFD